MSTFVQTRYVLGVSSGGELVEFAQPFVIPVVELDAAPSKFQVPIAASGTATLWAAASNFPAGFKVLGITADQDVRLTFTVSVGDPQTKTFTEDVRPGGFPILKFSDISKKADGSLGVINKIEALNLSSTDAVMVTVFIGD